MTTQEFNKEYETLISLYKIKIMKKIKQSDRVDFNVHLHWGTLTFHLTKDTTLGQLLEYAEQEELDFTCGITINIQTGKEAMAVAD